MAKNREVFRWSRSERKKIEKRRDQNSDRRIFRRLSALFALDDGGSQEEVARFLGTTARTVRRWIKIYRKGGLDGLCRLANEGRKCPLTDAPLETLRQQVEAGNFRAAKQARQWIADNFGVRYSLTATKELLRRLGATYHLRREQMERGMWLLRAASKTEAEGEPEIQQTKTKRERDDGDEESIQS